MHYLIWKNAYRKKHTITPKPQPHPTQFIQISPLHPRAWNRKAKNTHLLKFNFRSFMKNCPNLKKSTPLVVPPCNPQSRPRLKFKNLLCQGCLSCDMLSKMTWLGSPNNHGAAKLQGKFMEPGQVLPSGDWALVLSTQKLPWKFNQIGLTFQTLIIFLLQDGWNGWTDKQTPFKMNSPSII